MIISDHGLPFNKRNRSGILKACLLTIPAPTGTSTSDILFASTCTRVNSREFTMPETAFIFLRTLSLSTQFHPSSTIESGIPGRPPPEPASIHRSEEHTSELQSRGQHVCRLLLAKQNNTTPPTSYKSS